MPIVTVVGNRPQFVKAAAVSRRLRETHEELIVHTGQHHDDELSRVFFDELGVPAPDHQLHAVSGSNTAQTARILAELEPILLAARPELVLVYGDTNSTLAGALAAAQLRLPVAHVEAGMRSFDRSMPEELNRVLVDHAADLLLCSTATAVENLARESAQGETHLVGDVMADVSLAFQELARERSTALADRGLEPGGYLLVTAHRAGNVDPPERLLRLVELLEALPGPVVFPVHPRTRRRLEEHGLLERLARGGRASSWRRRSGTSTSSSWRAMPAPCSPTRAVCRRRPTSSGVPCVTLRDTTEWVETIDAGWNVLVDLDREAALAALDRQPAARAS